MVVVTGITRVENSDMAFIRQNIVFFFCLSKTSSFEDVSMDKKYCFAQLFLYGFSTFNVITVDLFSNEMLILNYR